jgi:Lon protease-like protein
MELPPHVPLFPLPNAVLFPGVPLPLHIFEPRYREMVRDVERSEDKLIGMVLLRGEWRKDYYGRPDIYPVGCAGRMVSVEPLPDGRYNILLQGVREFAVRDETADHSYRRGAVEWRAVDRRRAQRHAITRCASLPGARPTRWRGCSPIRRSPTSC